MVSILLAFSIDTWWAARGERAREAAVIAGLAGDLELHRSVLLANLAFTENILVAADSLAILSRPDAGTSNTNLTAVLARVLQIAPIGLQGGTLQTLVILRG